MDSSDDFVSKKTTSDWWALACHDFIFYIFIFLYVAWFFTWLHYRVHLFSIFGVYIKSIQ